MHKAMLIMLLTVVSSSAAAEWVEVGTDDTGTITIYADPATIRRSGDKVRMWHLYDYQTTQRNSGKRFMSVVTRTEHDCKEEQSRGLYVSSYSENMGGGTVVEIFDEPDKWLPVPPGTASAVLWELACKKR